MKTDEYVSLYKELMYKTKDKDVALKILEQLGLDSRTSFINEAKLEANKKPSKPQLDFVISLQKQGVIPTDIDLDKLSKEEASQILSEAKKQLPDY